LIIFNGGEPGGPAAPADDKIKNRGFCFLEFVDHKSASVAKRKLSKFNRVLNREIAVDWADPHEEPDEETMSKVKVLYVKNISAEVTEEEVQKLFETYGKLERVRKMKDYAFIHFEQRDECMKAMEEQQGKVLGKNALEISLARPLTDKKKQAQQKRNDNDHQFNRNRNNNFSNNNNNNNWNNNQMSGQNGRGFHNNNNNNRGGMNGGGGNRGYGGGGNNNRNNNQRSNFNNNFNGNMNRGGGGGGGYQNNNNFNRGKC
jgi:RNA recognition motif-containing protein